MLQFVTLLKLNIAPENWANDLFSGAFWLALGRVRFSRFNILEPGDSKQPFDPLVGHKPFQGSLITVPETNSLPPPKGHPKEIYLKQPSIFSGQTGWGKLLNVSFKGRGPPIPKVPTECCRSSIRSWYISILLSTNGYRRFWVVIPLIFPKVPQSFLQILKVP